MQARMERLLTMKPAFKIVLGTASQSRRAVMDELAEQYGFKYELCKADIDEKAIRFEEPRDLVLALAHAKADAIIVKLKQQQDPPGRTLLITCDQVVVHEGVILEKPEDAAEARAMIEGYRRAPASTVGSVVATNLETGARHQEVEVCTIHMDPLPDASISALIEEGEVMWCAGSLMIEHALVAPHIRGIDGSADAVMGLGKEAVQRVLAAAAGV